MRWISIIVYVGLVLVKVSGGLLGYSLRWTVLFIDCVGLYYVTLLKEVDATSILRFVTGLIIGVLRSYECYLLLYFLIV